MEKIIDYLKENLEIIFVGFNPSLVSGEVGHHYANPNNRFWKILHEAGLTPRKYSPYEDFKLLDLGYGLTNIVSRPTKAADEITKKEYGRGRIELKQKIEKYKPIYLCFVGKGVYQHYSGRKSASWGVQSHPIVDGVTDFVAPSSSGLVRMKMDEIVEIYRQLSILTGKINK